ncbi:hypothetical protein QP427_07425, partial [Bifidobacterium sp. UMB1230]|nr:hypothetical protein [Bifidobacterium sp. UMB1230]
HHMRCHDRSIFLRTGYPQKLGKAFSGFFVSFSGAFRNRHPLIHNAAPFSWGAVVAIIVD